MLLPSRCAAEVDLTSAAAAGYHAPDAQAVVVADGPRVIVDVRLQVAATRPQVWEVLTDYEGAPRFISKLRESKVLSRSA